MTLNLEPIKARVEKALKGPWYVGAMNDCLFIINKPPSPAMNDIGPHISERNKDIVDIAKLDYPGADANADFIAHARADIPALVAEVERLRAQQMWQPSFKCQKCGADNASQD